MKISIWNKIIDIFIYFVNRLMAHILNVPDDYELVCFLPIGIPKEKNVIKTKKKSFDERAWFNGFKNSK